MGLAFQQNKQNMKMKFFTLLLIVAYAENTVTLQTAGYGGVSSGVRMCTTLLTEQLINSICPFVATDEYFTVYDEQTSSTNGELKAVVENTIKRCCQKPCSLEEITDLCFV